MPLVLTKTGLADAGERLVTRFCKANGLVVPSIVRLTPESSDLYYVGSCAFYRRNRICIMLPKCAHPGTAGMAWSWPGYIIDRTPYGVLAHETGHHVDLSKGERPGRYWSELGERIMKESGEAKLTNYCPNPAEWFAEMSRLFITNPDLLRLIRPVTYRLLRGFLEPVETRPWRKVLAGAPPRTIAVAEKRIREATV